MYVRHSTRRKDGETHPRPYGRAIPRARPARRAQADAPSGRRLETCGSISEHYAEGWAASANLMLMDELLRQLEKKCEDAGLTVEELTEEIEEDGHTYAQHLGWSIKSTTGAFDESAHLIRNEDVAFALDTKFEEWRPIEGYEAIWSPAHGVVEAELVLRPGFGAEHPFERLARILGIASPADPRGLSIPVPTREGRPVISLRYASAELKVWRTTSPAAHLISRDSMIPAIRIEGLDLQDANGARNALEAWANGSFLEIDQCTGIPIRLRTHYPFRISFSSSRPRPSLSAVVSAPEPIPARLYWYARQSEGHAAQFLGFYHVLEYFFPRYSIAEEVTRLREELSSAYASIDEVSEDTIRVILSATYRHRGIGPEKEQLQKLLKKVVPADELRSFLDGDRALRNFYMQATMPVVSERISLENPRADIYKQSAYRLYQIRCRIVHTKEDRRKEAFVPFSAEAAELAADVRLISYLAQKVLLANTKVLDPL